MFTDGSHSDDDVKVTCVNEGCKCSCRELSLVLQMRSCIR